MMHWEIVSLSSSVNVLNTVSIILLNQYNLSATIIYYLSVLFTCYRERDTEEHYIEFKNLEGEDGGCWSYLGYQGLAKQGRCHTFYSICYKGLFFDL